VHYVPSIGSITDLLKWSSHINLFIFLSESLVIRRQASGVRFQVSAPLFIIPDT